MRDAVLEKQNEASLKQKQRERVQPKMGKLDIDYQKLRNCVCSGNLVKTIEIHRSYKARAINCFTFNPAFQELSKVLKTEQLLAIEAHRMSPYSDRAFDYLGIKICLRS